MNKDWIKQFKTLKFLMKDLEILILTLEIIIKNWKIPTEILKSLTLNFKLLSHT